jgi:pSer/pThr/pTyr-binding forkhead associated (FHA) protein
MKVELVVASGVHQGRVIPIVVPEFLIGRDTQCHLRPASQAVSKMHCAIVIRNGQVYVKDFGSTNGTLVNEVTIRGAEVQVKDGARLKIGPLDFQMRIQVPPPQPDGTPLPEATPETATALAAAQAASPTPAARDTTPHPGSLVTSESAAAKKGSKEHTPIAAPNITQGKAISDQDRIAAILLSLESEEVPEGSTIADVPALKTQQSESESSDKKSDKKQVPTREEMSNAASEALRRILRRPR